MEGARESHPRVHDLQHQPLGKPSRGLQIMGTRMVIDSIDLGGGNDLKKTFHFQLGIMVTRMIYPKKVLIIMQVNVAKHGNEDGIPLSFRNVEIDYFSPTQLIYILYKKRKVY